MSATERRSVSLPRPGSTGKPLDRREFLAGSLVAAAALGASGRADAGVGAAPAEAEWRNRQPGMKYRRLGRTGFMVSEIVQGGDPITPENYRHVEMAVERGLNYLDTAPVYAGGKSEPGYAEVLKAVGRDNVFLTTKVSPLGGARNKAYQEIFAGLTRAEQEAVLTDVADNLKERQATLPSYMGNYFVGQLQEIENDALSDVLERRYPGRIDARATYAETMTRSLEESLRRLGTDHVDILMCPHGASSYAETQVPEIHETFERLREQGKVRALGVSAHNDPAGVLRGAIASGVYSVAMVAYNIVNHAYVEPALREAKAADFGVVAMKVAQAVFQPNRDAIPRPERVALLESTVPGEGNVFQKAYRYGLSNPSLSAVISNMVDEKQMEENLAVIG
jgi:aryl-alcohol dehydrogenase-like predicted oxidoreductase